MSQSHASAPPDGHVVDEEATHQHLIQIHVNNRPVEVLGPKTTGAAI